MSVRSDGSVYHGTDSASVMCGVTGFPPPDNLTWTWTWPGQLAQNLTLQYNGSTGQEGEEEQEQEGHYVSVTKDLKMSDSNWSSEVNLSCSACNSLGCGSSSSLTLYIVGKTSITASRRRGSFSFQITVLC